MTPFLIKKKTRETGSGRVFLSVSKAVFKKASARNLLKRRIRSVIRPFLKQREDVVIVVKPSASALSYEGLKKELRSLLVR